MRRGSDDPAVEHRRALTVMALAVAAVPLLKRALGRSSTQVHRHDPGRR